MTQQDDSTRQPERRMTMRKACISLWKFKQIIDNAWKRRDGATGMVVIFYVGNEEYDLVSVGQFHVMPDVTIELKKPSGVK